MSQHMERCPVCGPTEVLTPRTNGFGGAFLECACGYREAVTRRADPFPTREITYTAPDGYGRKRYRGHGAGTIRVGRKRPVRRA